MKTSNKFLLVIIIGIFVAVSITAIVVGRDVSSRFVFSFHHKVIGDGSITTKTQILSDFKTVDIIGVNRIIIQKGAKSQVAIKTDQNILPYIETYISGGVLYIRAKPSVSLSPSKVTMLTVTAKDLQGITLSGANELSSRNINSKQFTVNISGVGKCDLVGKADNLYLNISGASKISAANFIAKDVRVQLSGAGKVITHATQSIEIKLFGSGLVQYYGNPPEVSKHVFGVGKIENMGAK